MGTMENHQARIVGELHVLIRLSVEAKVSFFTADPDIVPDGNDAINPTGNPTTRHRVIRVSVHPDCALSRSIVDNHSPWIVGGGNYHCSCWQCSNEARPTKNC
jgi:hypothetical protein